MKAFLGNDLVDRAATHNRGRAQQARYLARIATAAERERFACSTDGDREFARLWSAKEAAYKAMRKRDPRLVFAPRRWQVEGISSIVGSPATTGAVSIVADGTVTVRWIETNDWVHCVAIAGEPPDVVALDVGTVIAWDRADVPRERVHGAMRAESRAARNLARDLLRRHGISDVEIVRTPVSGEAHRAPPRVVVGSTLLSGIDVSLAHDGRFVAAAVALDHGERR